MFRLTKQWLFLRVRSGTRLTNLKRRRGCRQKRLHVRTAFLRFAGKHFHSRGPRFVNQFWCIFSGLAQAVRREPNPACVLSVTDLVARGAFSNPRMSLKRVRTEKGKRQGEDLLSEGLGGKGFEGSHESGAPGDTIHAPGRVPQQSRAVLLSGGLVSCPIRFQGLAEPGRREPGGRPQVRLSEASGRRRAVSSCVVASARHTRYRSSAAPVGAAWPR